MEKIPTEQVLKRLAVENPWWASPFQVQEVYTRWSPRPYLELFYPLLKGRAVRRAVVLLGPRRVGKTVLLHHAIARLLAEGAEPRRICYVSVDHPLYNGCSLERLLDLYRQATGVDFEREECTVVFDEIQYLKGWEVHLKSLVDTFPALKCAASGSAAAALRLKSDESGAGRFTDFLLPPLTFYEYLELKNETALAQLEPRDASVADIEALNQAFVHYLNFGGYPEVVLSTEIQAEPGRFIKSDIIDKVLLRDLPSLYGIQDIQELNSLFTTLAFNTAQEVSLEALAQGSGVAKATLKRYIEYLEAAFLIRTVHRVDKNARHFQRAMAFKVHLTNPSMRTALFSPLSADDLGMGAQVETGIFSQAFHSSHLRFFYARWPGGEIDLVTVGPDQKALAAIEIKWTDRHTTRDDELKPVVDFCHENNLKSALVTTRTVQSTRTIRSVEIDFVPAAFYCLVLGAGMLLRRQADQLPETA